MAHIDWKVAAVGGALLGVGVGGFVAASDDGEPFPDLRNLELRDQQQNGGLASPSAPVAVNRPTTDVTSPPSVTRPPLAIVASAPSPAPVVTDPAPVAAPAPAPVPVVASVDSPVSPPVAPAAPAASDSPASPASPVSVDSPDSD